MLQPHILVRIFTPLTFHIGMKVTANHNHLRPGCLNSLAGLISTIINVYGQQDGVWSLTAEVTGIVTGACAVVTAVLFLIYNLWLLEKVRRSHRGDMARWNEHPNETLVEKVERKVNEPALEPGSVV